MTGDAAITASIVAHEVGLEGAVCPPGALPESILQVLLLAVGLVMTGHAVLTPMLMVIVMITGDFLAMSLTTDRVRPSKMPNS